MSIIGLAGLEGAGKTTAADYLAPRRLKEKKTVWNPWSWLVGLVLNQDCPEIPLSRVRSTVAKSNPFLGKLLKVCDKVFKGDLCSVISFGTQIPLYEPVGQRKQVILAEPLKQICAIFTGLDYSFFDGSRRHDRETFRFNFLGARYTPRSFLIRVANDIFRNGIDPDFWVQIAQREIDPLGTIIPDLRFQNELQLVTRVILIRKQGHQIPEFLQGHEITIVSNDSDLPALFEALTGI